MISNELKQQITNKVQHCLAIAKQQYDIDVPMPSIIFQKRGRVAGVAMYRSWCIDLNPQLLVDNVDHYLNDVVPHETAHLITSLVYPETLRSRYGQKRSIHGYEWQSVMRTLGVQPKRCHNMDVSKVKQHKSKGTRFEYECQRCKHVLELTPYRHQQLQKDPAIIWHSGCRGALLKLVGSPSISTPVNHTPKTPVKQPSNGSKLSMCYDIYKRFKDVYDRKTMIYAFINRANCTSAGASTYYATCKKNFG